MLKKLLCKIFNLVPKAQYDQLDKRFSESSSLMKRDLEKHSSNIEMLLCEKHSLEEMYSLLQKEYNDTLAKSSMEQGALNNKIKELLEEVQKNEEELRRRGLDIQALLEKNRIVEDNNANLLQAIEKVNIENSELKKCISYYTLLIAAVNAKKNQEIQILKYENETHNLQIEGFGVEKNRLVSEIEQLNSNLGNAIAQNQEYKLQIKTLEQAREKNKVESAQQSVALSSALKSLNEESSRLSTAVREMEQLRKDNKNLKDVLKVRESRLNELEEKLEGSKKDKEILEQKNSEISQLRSDVYKYTRQLSIERGILSSSQEKFDLEKDELKNELAKKDILNKELKETYQKYVNHLLEEKNVLEVSESKLREENISLGRLIEEYRDKLNDQSEKEEAISFTDTIDNGSHSNLEEVICTNPDVQRFIDICKEIAKKVGVPNIVVIADKLAVQFNYLSDNIDFYSFVEQIIKNDSYFVQTGSAHNVCFNTVIQGIKLNKSDIYIIDNSVKAINDYLIKLYKSPSAQIINSDEKISFNQSVETESYTDLDLEKTNISLKQKDVISKFRKVCRILSQMFLLLPHMKYLDKLTHRAIELYNSGNKQISFYTFVCTSSIEKRYPSLVKTTMVDILDLIRDKKDITEVIKTIEKKNRVKVDFYERSNKNIFPRRVFNNEKSEHNKYIYEIIYPLNFYQKSEIQLYNSRLIIHGGKLYHNALSRTAQLDNAYSTLIYTSNNIYITKYREKKGIIYIGKKVRTILKPDCLEIIYNKKENSFEVLYSNLKSEVLPMSKILSLKK